MNYKDFIIKIESKRDNHYNISVESPAGEGSSKLELPFGLKDAPEIMQRLAGTFRGVAEEQSPDKTRDVVIEISGSSGSTDLPKTLFDSLFSGSTKTLFDQSLGMVSSDSNTGLRIKLQIDPENAEVAELASLPWELLYREDTRDYLNLSRSTPLVRYLNVQRPSHPLAFQLPLRILVVMSNPEGVAQLDLDSERQLIEQSWARYSGVEVDFLPTPASTQQLSEQLSKKEYHVLHYMGHGDFDKASGQGVLLLEDENRQAQALNGQTLGVILHDVTSLRLVFLNACNTAKASKQEGQDPFAGVATAMVLAGIPAVLAMQFPITDKAAVSFSGTFYPRLVSGYPVDAAVAEGRKAIKLNDPNSMEWATPVLFMRSADGVLFDIAEPMPKQAPLATPEIKPASVTTASSPASSPQDKVSSSASSAKQSDGKFKLLAIAAVIIMLAVIASFLLMPQTKVVPSITIDNGFNVSQASGILKDHQLIVSEELIREPSKAKANTVIRTQPAAGSEVVAGDQVQLVVSNGTYQLEGLEGKSEQELVALFDSIPLELASIEYVISDQAEGSFVSSEPAVSSIVPHGTEVSIQLATNGLIIPEISGMEILAATDAMDAVGLTYVINKVIDFEKPVGTVIKTKPNSGTKWPVDKPVDIYLSVFGGWVYFEERLEPGLFQNDGTARTLRKLDEVGDNRVGTLPARANVTVIDTSGKWALVRLED